MKAVNRSYDLVIIGGSAGAIQALPLILAQLPESFSLPIVIVLHRLEGSGSYLHQYFKQYCVLPVVEVEDKQPLLPGQVYIAPAGYHLLVENEGHFSLSIDPRVNYCRPSIDVLLESAADSYANRLVGIILTGANTDGSKGLKQVKEAGGLTIVQRPTTAAVDIMPRAAIKATDVDWILDLEEIGFLLAEIQYSDD
ncbi:CheB methylesterase [Psychromonas ingrahamii 37]|uniref:protein-glutamate methylesterase n=1 Tax=Psychromonas ingrahamii (strain DSM 17664 / CCUG 51855 / 37) TaxID=357804 RepID=A1T0Y0_PSYIN|nr:chemotaxis protein CheB [Psychromonas ingrahamii]ABM05395.1 CheB methylesterase [Psychromonas ingrahamii 37]